MCITNGPIVRKQLKTSSSEEDLFSLLSCDECGDEVEKESQITCLHPDCDLNAHIVCLASKFLEHEASDEHMLPVEGCCPKCSTVLLWGHLVRKKLGCQDLGS